MSSYCCRHHHTLLGLGLGDSSGHLSSAHLSSGGELEADLDAGLERHGHAGHAGDGSRGFQLPGDQPRWSRPRPFAIEHLHADLALDLDQRSVEGEAMLLVRRIDRAAVELRLDAIDFEIREVSVGDSAARYHYDGRVLVIEVGDNGNATAADLAVRVRYRATPSRGLYFIAARPPLTAPDPSARATEVWSQGQDEDNRCWLPLADHPGERMTTELVVSVPKDWFALSNGVLVERSVGPGSAHFRWRQSEPHAPYLITLACGRFDEGHDHHGELPVDYYVPVGRGSEIPRSLGKTPQMIALFEQRLGTKYPWAKYAQVVVHDFIFGGMENTSATTLYDRALLDERAALDVDMEPLVAHELAHQWFGDLVTCRDWSHAWLNEGFATYCEHLWREHTDGLDGYLFGLEHDLDIYLDEDRDRYRRPIVTNVYSKPIDIFDRHLYQKGGLVLHALRRHLGDEAFFRGLAHYLATMRGKSAETRDLLRALEDATGRSLEAFFDQWVHRAGHPTIEVTSEHDAGVLRVTVTQTQVQRADPATAFTFSLPIVVTSEAGQERYVLEVSRARETFALKCAKAPRMVLIDPDSDLLGTCDNRLSTALLAEQLASAPSSQPRWRAARTLGKRSEPRALKGLVEALGRDAFWGVRAECASALGEQRSPDALSALLGASAVEPDPRVRRSIAAALGRFEGSAPVGDRLIAWMAAGDRSYLVEAELRRSLGRIRDPRALEVLSKAFREDAVSWNECVRQGAIDGLASLRDPAVLAVLAEGLDPRHAAAVRRSAMVGLGKARAITADEPRLVEAREAIVRGLDTFDPAVRTAGARALASLRDPAGAAPIQRLIDRDLDGRVRRIGREALRDLRDRLARGRETTALRDDLEKLQKEVRELRDKLTVVEARK